MNRDDLIPYLEPLQQTGSFLTTALCGMAAVAAVTLGVYGFIKVGNSEREDIAERQSVQAGEVQPETLTVVRKYSNRSPHGTSSSPHVIFRSARQAEINYSATRQFYDSLDLGATVTGYYFPEGYYIPGGHGQDAGLAKWIFLAFGLATGTVLAVAAWKARG